MTFLRVVGGASLAAMLVTTAASQPTTPTPAADQKVYIGGTTKTEEAILQQWLDETYAVLRSTEFHQNLGSLNSTYPKVWMSSWELYRTPSQLADILRLKDPMTERKPWWVPTPVALAGSQLRSTKWTAGFDSSSNFDAITGFTGYLEGGVGENSMRLGRANFERYRSPKNKIERSCAINTLAHEISHTLSKEQGQNLQYMMDTEDGRPGPAAGEPYASYLIGSVAQCTYLQKVDRIPRTTAAFKTCLATFAVAKFEVEQCDDYGDNDVFPKSKAKEAQPQTANPAG